jgi:putative hemolysin
MDSRLSITFALVSVGLGNLLISLLIAAEFALLNSHPAKLRTSECKERGSFRHALLLVRQSETSITAVRFGIVVLSLLLGWFGTIVLAISFSAFSDGFPQILASSVFPSGLVIASAFLALVSLVIISIYFAKSLANKDPECMLCRLAIPIFFYVKIISPVVSFYISIVNFFLRAFGFDVEQRTNRFNASEELAELAGEDVEAGKTDIQEEAMLHRVFSFSDMLAKEVMTPRTELVSVPLSATLDEVLKIVVENGFSRYPVVGESVDDVQGMLLAKDIVAYALQRERRGAESEEFDIKKLKRKAYFIPETKPIGDLLTEFKKRKMHIAVVVDEHGGVDGIVTLEDLLEEIVGDIQDELDEPAQDIVEKEKGLYVIEGGVAVTNLNNRLEIKIPEGEYDTVAGFVYTSLGRMPKEGDRILITEEGSKVINGKALEEFGLSAHTSAVLEESKDVFALVTVDKLDGPKIEQVLFQRLYNLEKSESSPVSSAS